MISEKKGIMDSKKIKNEENAMRKVDVTIQNDTDEKLILITGSDTKLISGDWQGSDMPPISIEANSSKHIYVKGDTFMDGASFKVKYESEKTKQSFKVEAHNPYIGSNTFDVSASTGKWQIYSQGDISGNHMSAKALIDDPT